MRRESLTVPSGIPRLGPASSGMSLRFSRCLEQYSDRQSLERFADAQFVVGAAELDEIV